jgi:hypothetical protein
MWAQLVAMMVEADLKADSAAQLNQATSVPNQGLMAVASSAGMGITTDPLSVVN